MSKPYSIVTCCNRYPTEEYYILNEFVKSLGEDEAIVLNETWGGKWDGLGTKAKWLYRAIKEGVINTEYLIFCDCWDLVFAKPPSELFANYLKYFEAELVISAEKNCFPTDLKDEYDKLPYKGKYKYLNSGMIVGKTSAMLKVLEAMDLDNVPDDYRGEDGNMVHINDQLLYMQVFLQQPVYIQLDHLQILCNTLHDVELKELEFIEGGGIINKSTESQPCSFHANGGAKSGVVIPKILEHLHLR